jgi:hypothetical protein
MLSDVIRQPLRVQPHGFHQVSAEVIIVFRNFHDTPELGTGI